MLPGREFDILEPGGDFRPDLRPPGGVPGAASASTPEVEQDGLVCRTGFLKDSLEVHAGACRGVEK